VELETVVLTAAEFEVQTKHWIPTVSKLFVQPELRKWTAADLASSVLRNDRDIAPQQHAGTPSCCVQG
jgi:hypothetical protein